MQLTLLLQLCLLGLGLSVASPGRRFLMGFPPHNDPTVNVSHQVIVTALDVWTSVTVKVLESSFMQQIFLPANKSKTIYLPPAVEIRSDHSSHILSVTSVRPVTVLASFCTQFGCDHSLLYDVSSWGTSYYPITPHFPNKTHVSQLVITSSDRETLVDIFLSGEVLFKGNIHPKGSVLRLHLGVLQSVSLQSSSSFSGSQLNSQEAVGVVVGFTCSKHSPGGCSYGFSQLKPVSLWSFNYIIPPINDTQMTLSFLLAMTSVNTDLRVTHGTVQQNVSLPVGVMKTITIVTSDKTRISSDSPLQLVYFRLHNGQRPSTLIVLPSVADICQPVAMFDSGDMSEWGDNSNNTEDLKHGVEFSKQPNFARLPDNPESSSLHPDAGLHLSNVNGWLYPAVCGKAAASCEELHCSPKQKCSVKHGTPLCSLETKICSAWGDSFYRTFSGRDFVLQGNCNYTLVQTSCPGLNTSVPLEINMARAYLNSATLSTIHTVQISIMGFNISIVKDEKNHVRINGLKKNLPLTLGNGSLSLYASGSSVVLEAVFGLVLRYDWKHHLQVEVGPAFYGHLCGLCGNALHASSDDAMATKGSDKTHAVDFTLPWVVDSATGSCIENCGGVSCAVCSRSTTKTSSGTKRNFFEIGCTLLQRSGGPFANCHSYIDPEPFVRSCVDSVCVNGAASSLCKVFTAYASICQKVGARVYNWRSISKCPMACPMNSHYEICGSACPATCSNPEAHHNCTLPCVESCQCNKGYLLSSGSCVPHSKCGCVHQGSYYLPKENFWTDEQCQEECVCQPNSKKVMCAHSNCQEGEMCKVLNGVLGCQVHGPGVCIAKGDPHYTTFDGRDFDVNGNCTYLLTSHCPAWGDLEDFNVEVQNQMKNSTNVSFHWVKMLVSGYSIELSNDWSDQVKVNGLLLHFPYVLSRGKINLYMTGLSKCIETDFGVIVTYSSHSLTVQMPRIFSGTLCGLCGNFNGNPHDDLMPDDDTDNSQAISYWQTSHDECVYVPANTSGCSSQDMALYRGKDFCGRLLDAQGTFQSCHKTIDPQDFYDNCVHDLCYGNETTLCQILSSYVSLCQEMGALVAEWRASNFCYLSCPPNSEYHLCSSHVSDCVESPQTPHGLKCKEGCFCKPGFFYSGDKCVPNSECGCIYDGVYREIHESFHPDEHCQLHCVCVSHNRVQCTKFTCQNGTKCTILDGHRTCHALYPVKCTVMGGRHFRSYDGDNFDFNMGSYHYVLSQSCDDEEESDPTVVFQQGQLYIRVYGLNISLEMEHLGKVKINGVLRGTPVQLAHVVILRSGMLIRVVVDTGVVVTYGGPNLVQIAVPTVHRQMCGLCKNVAADMKNGKQKVNGSFANEVPIFASSSSLSPPRINCSDEWGSCPVCNSSMTAEFASDSLCGMLLSSAGSFSQCHSTVDPRPFFRNCVNDLCMSNGSKELFCSRLTEYSFACQDAGAMVKPWRGAKCTPSCPENSHYNICVDACPESCGILSDIACPWPCYEGCRCDPGHVQSGNGCVTSEQCGCLYHGYYYEIGAILWAEGCSERCNCSAANTMCCEQASCPEGESCTLNNTWGCARNAGDNKTCENGETCVQNTSQQRQCWVLGGAHFYTFDGQMFEFQGNCTYTLIHLLNDTSESNTFWVRVEKDRTPHETSSVKAIHVKVAEDKITVFRGDRGSVWVNGEKRPLSATLQFGLVKIHRTDVFVVVETRQGVQIKYDCSDIATILLSSKIKVSGICGNNNGIKEDDFRTPRGEIVDAATFAWSWRVPEPETRCTADCGDTCPHCSAEHLQERDLANEWISLHEYLWSPQNPFYLCHNLFNYTTISTTVSMFDLCSNNDTQQALCSTLEAYAAACRNDTAHIVKWRNSTFCPISCPVNSHYESCGTACPATCESPLGSGPCTQACVEMCQCNQGFVLDSDTCVPLSQCGCTHNGDRYPSNQTFWADERCTEKCVCDPRTRQIRCNQSSCGSEKYCGVRDGVRSCTRKPRGTCLYTGHHIITFDRHDYDFHGTCQYQLLGVTGQNRDLSEIQVHVQTDGHMGSALHALVNVSGVFVELNSKNMDNIEVDGVKRNLPCLLSATALAFSLGLHTYIYMNPGFEFSLSIEGIVAIRLSQKYANATSGLCGNFNADPTDDLIANGTKDLLTPGEFAKLWRSGQNPWCVEGCLGGSCPNCSSERLARFSDPEACGKILEVNGPFRHCHGKVDPSSFYTRCVTDLCLHGGLQTALCHSLADYAAVCFSRKATVYAWRRPGFCYQLCPSSTSYNMSSAPVHLCLVWQNNTVEVPPNIGENCLCEAGLVRSGNLCVTPENCGCLHHGEYLKAGQEVSTCQQSCLCHAGGHMTCHKVSCGEDQECKLIRGVQGCHPKPKEAYCSVDGSQYTTFDGKAFEFYGSSNYTLVQMCSLKKADVQPILIAAEGNRTLGRQLHLQVGEMYFQTSKTFPGKIQVNGVYENLPFSQNNITIHKENGWITIKVPQSVELISDLQSHILIKIPNIYQRTTCGLCGNYNDDPLDDLQLPNGVMTSDLPTFGPPCFYDANSSCSNTCGSSCQICQAPVPEYTSVLYCGLLTNPSGPFAPCHHLVCSQKYYSLCMRSLCIAEGQRWALCEALWAYEAACKVTGGVVDLWMNTTGCTYKCPRSSHYSPCANVCSSVCPEILQEVQCPENCEEGCQCDAGHLYDGAACVPAEHCGCMQDGRKFKPSESKLLHNCTVNYTCGPPLICEQQSCPPLHSCKILHGVMGCHEDVPNMDPCEGKCDKTEKCSLRNGLPVCQSLRGLCWARGGQHYHTFDGLKYNFEGACTYLLTASKGAACGLTRFSVSKKNDCKASPSTQVLTVQVYGFIIRFTSETRTLQINDQVTYIPVNLLRGKIQISYKEGDILLKADFGMHVVLDWNSTVVIMLDPRYKGNVYGLCGNFNGDSQDEFPDTAPAFPSVKLPQAYQLFDRDSKCCSSCRQQLDVVILPADNVTEVFSSHNSRLAHCPSRADLDSFYQTIVDHMHNEDSVTLNKTVDLYTTVCEEVSDYYFNEGTIDAHCPPNSHYKTCGSACPPSCEPNDTICRKICVQGCFCNPGFIKSPQGCIRPHQCGCQDSRGKYHSINSTFWVPDNCGQLCVCGPAAGEIHCNPDQCPKGMVCRELRHKRACQPEKPKNCSIVTGLHFTTFDGYHFDFRDSCAYSLVETSRNLTGVMPFNISMSDASCHKRFSHSQTLTLSLYGLEVMVRKDNPGKVLVDGLYKPLPYSHQTGHVNVHNTPSSLVVQTDEGLKLIVYNTGTLMIILPSSYSAAVSGLCGNANSDPHDDQMMPNAVLAQNTLEFAHSWKSQAAETCRFKCPYRLKHCPLEAQKLFEGNDFCGILLNELGPFADCASVLSPKSYFHSCVVDSCSYNGHYSAVCNSIASYAAACQAAQLPVWHWRSDTFCGMPCPRKSHYEICGPRCPAVCAGLSSSANCSGGCEEGCQCDPGYVLSDGHCVLVSDCGCMHGGQYHPAGLFYLESCQKCECKRGDVTCSPMESCLVDLQHGVCQVFSGFGYITFDGVILPHHGACIYVLSTLTSKAAHDYTLLLSFKKDTDGNFTISRLVLRLPSFEVSIDPGLLWKIQINGEDRSVSFDNGELKAYQIGSRLIVTTLSGLRIDLSSTQYLRLSVPQVYDGTISGLCGNFNGDKSDDLQMRNGHLAQGFSEFLHSWAPVSPGQNCTDTCGRNCDECNLSTHDTTVCDTLLADSSDFKHCWSSGVEREVYRFICIRAVCAGAGHRALCLALEAYSAACQAKGISVGLWREHALCSLQCPDRSRPTDCVDSSSNSCPALLQPGSLATGCAEGCQCSYGNVFDVGECVPYSQCGCALNDVYIKTDEQLYTKDCAQKCWCHPLGGVICEEVSCSPGQQCALRNGSWGCSDRREVCELRGSLHVSTLSGQQLSLEPQSTYSLMSLCDKASVQWFNLISYYGHCDGSSTLVTVFQIILHDMSIAIRGGTVKVNGHLVPLPHVLPSGLSLSSGVNEDKSEVIVILRREAGLESELEIEIGVTTVTVKVPLWYSGKLCGICGNLHDPESHSSVKSWVLHDLPGCDLTG